jgi:7,8-dihydropterin-6-yl-methyl-4-(beta-D-ribofuranosyl)aminobenzene 5'-phosphate synthase
MSRIESFGETQDVEITVLVDNRADLMLESTDTVKRFFDEPLLAEHGFAALIDLKDAGVRILWDAGITEIALMENAARMEIDLAMVDRIALSHGHHDHFAAMAEAIEKSAVYPTLREWDEDATMEEIREWVKGRKVDLIAHPAAFRERWGIDDDGKRYGPAIVPRDEWEAIGANVILSEGPYRLGPGCWTTGGVPRLSFEQAGVSKSRIYREGDEFVRDYMDDDQSVVVNVKGKGLVVLSGCAHAGIVNTVNYAKEISGVSRVWAIIGGFHLGRADDEDIQRTVDAIKELEPTMVVPMHCTGFKAISQFAAQMPDEFVLGVVGTTYLF